MIFRSNSLAPSPPRAAFAEIPQRWSRLVALSTLGLAVMLFGTACPHSGNSEPAQEQPKPRLGSFSEAVAETSAMPERSIDRSSLQNMSELLAGILPPEAPDEPAEGLASTPDGAQDGSPDPVWLQHSTRMNEIWQQLDTRFAAMRSWSDTELSTLLQDPQAPLVYPFGGPDLITAMQFFPNAKSYILVGLEAPGRLPLPEDFSGDALADDLKLLSSTFDSLVQSGYFVRSHLDKGVHETAFDGVLPILLICLARSGHQPLAVDYVTFDRETLELRPLPAEAEEAASVRILFQRQGDALGSTRAVYYFAQDLSNRGLLSDDPFARMLRRQESLNVYMKAAEYLLHTGDFLQFRKVLLGEAAAILQDDSGIPIRHFTSDRWRLEFFGKFENVLAAYKPFFQEDLAAAFRKQSRGELPFSLGYNAGGDGGGLMLALRKAEESSSE